MPDQVSNPRAHVAIEITRRSDPIEGRLVEPDGTCVVFHGWLQLTAALEEIRSRSRDGESR